MNEQEEKWDLDQIILLIQFIMFYITFFGGIVLIILSAVKALSLPLLGVILAYAVLSLIQIGFLIAFVKQK